MAKMDILDKKYELKKFLRLIFEKVDFEEEEIGVRLLNKEKEINIAKKFDDIDKLIDFVLNHYKIYEVNAYFYLCTFKKNSESFEEKDIAYRYCLACDFDRKDFDELNIDKAIKLYKKSGLSYHAIVDSGNGYHIYSCIERTNNFKSIKKINDKLKNATSCDSNALNVNQMLRLPCTFNIKDKKLFVNPYYTQNKNDEKFNRYKLNEAYSSIYSKSNFSHTFNNTPLCIEKALREGTSEGQRHDMLMNILGYYKSINKTKEETRSILEKWAMLSNYKNFDKEFDYYWKHNKEDKANKFYGFFFDCENCKLKDECNFIKNKKLYEEFEFDEGYEINDYNSNTLRKGVMYMNGNELLVSNILYSDRDIKLEFTRDEIAKELTYKKKCRLSKPTLIKTLKSLEEKGYIEVKKGNARAKIKDTYKLTSKLYNIKEENDIKISNLATSMCVCRNITTNELKLYYVLRLIHHKRESQGKETYCGSLLCMTQKEIAKEFERFGGGTNAQSNISTMIKNLCECRMMKVIDVKKSENNKYDYYVYKLYC